MIEFFIRPLSTYAGDIDQVITIIGVLTGFWWALTQGMFFWLMWRYRAKEGVRGQYVTGKEKPLKRWINWPHYLIIFCDFIIIAAGVRVWYNVKQDLPEADMTIRVVSQQWAWSFVHPGPDGELDTEDDIKTVDDLNLVVGKTYHWKLESRDVLHSFSIPVFRLKQDAIPGREITGWFKPTKTGTYDIQCAEMCGIGHGIMNARIVIRSPEDHAAWVAANTTN